MILMLLLVTSLSAEWPKSESRTAAYVVGSLEGFQQWTTGGLREEDKVDPFGGGLESPRAAERMKKWTRTAPASRFFREGDELWDAKAVLLKAKVLGPGGSWAILNNTTGRVVMSGGKAEHDRLGTLIQIQDEGPILLSTEASLLKVRCREMTGVDWEEKLVKERQVAKLHEIGVIARPGQKATTELKRDGTVVNLRVEPNVGADHAIIDLRMSYKAKFSGSEDPFEVDVSTGLTSYSEIPTYLEVGSRSDPEHILLLEVKTAVQFLDGTPKSKWREFEDPKHDPPRLEVGHEHPKEVVMEDGLIRRTWEVPPTFLDDLSFTSEDGAGERRRRPVFEAPNGIVGVAAGDTLIDMGEIMKETGIEIPAGGWVVYNQRTSMVIAQLDEENSDLMEQLLDGG